MSLDVLNPLIIKDHKPKGGFCLIKSNIIDNLRYAPVYNDFGLTTDSWRKLANYSTPVRYTTSTVYDGKLYNFGGLSTSTYLNTAFYYNPITTIWTSFAGADPIARFHHCVVYTPEHSGRFISFGGNTISGASNTVRYTSVTGPYTWTNATNPIPINRDGMTGSYWNGKVYLWGGNVGYLSVYDVFAGTWASNSTMSSLTTTPTVQVMPGVVDTDNGILYQAGWQSGDTGMNVWSMKLSDGTGQYSWVKLPCVGQKPIFRNTHTILYNDGLIYIIGGQSINSPITTLNEVWAYNINGGIWTKLSMDNYKVGTQYASSQILNGKIYCLGGTASGAVVLSDFHSYDLLKNYGMAIRLMRD